MNRHENDPSSLTHSLTHSLNQSLKSMKLIRQKVRTFWAYMGPLGSVEQLQLGGVELVENSQGLGVKFVRWVLGQVL